jgi:hypothetical protein
MFQRVEHPGSRVYLPLRVGDLLIQKIGEVLPRLTRVCTVTKEECGAGVLINPKLSLNLATNDLSTDRRSFDDVERSKQRIRLA